MTSSSPLPLIGVPTSIMEMPGSKFTAHVSGMRYIESLNKFSNCLGVLIPSLGADYDYAELAQRFDGILLTGGRANVEPHHYGGPPFPDDEPIDPDRDTTVLRLIPACIEANIPLFGICRGLQEINVALGGSLHYRVNEVAGKNDHRMPRGDGVTVEDIYALRHPVTLTPGGLFQDLTGKDEVPVNTLHGQGIDRLADGLAIEAVSDDGIIEGIRVENHANFAAAVQWHTEFHPEREEHALSRKLYGAFGEAAAERAKNR
jgi:putative glutamine amidotransferase